MPREVFQEAGEAIGNVGRRLFRRRLKTNDAERALRRWLKQVPLPQIAANETHRAAPEGEVIDTTYRVIPDEEGEPT